MLPADACALSLHDALPICIGAGQGERDPGNACLTTVLNPVAVGIVPNEVANGDLTEEAEIDGEIAGPCGQSGQAGGIDVAVDGAVAALQRGAGGEADQDA